MKKKLTAQGPRDRKSFTVTLPIEWVKGERLDKLRSVDLEIVGRKIVISPEKELQETVVLNGELYQKNLIKVIQALYRIGVNEIKFLFEDSSTLSQLQSIIEQYLIGYEIVEQKKDYVIIKEITKESEESFNTILRRIFLLILELSQSEDINQTDILHRNCKRLINYCQRIIVKKGYTEYLKTPLYYLLLDRIEKICDEFKWILNLRISADERTQLKEPSKIFRVLYELFYKFDPEIYDKYQYRTYELKNTLKTGKITQVQMHLHNLARLLNSLCGDIFILKWDG